jgi:hypothetical protein
MGRLLGIIGEEAAVANYTYSLGHTEECHEKFRQSSQ